MLKRALSTLAAAAVLTVGLLAGAGTASARPVPEPRQEPCSIGYHHDAYGVCVPNKVKGRLIG